MEEINRGQANPVGYRWLMQHVGHQDDDCLLWPFAVCTPGYGMFSYQKIARRAHRFMCEQVHGLAPSPHHHAAHSCGNRRCVNPRHLSWKTQTDNQLDRRKHGTHNKTRLKLTPLQADQIRKLRGIESSVETAARYGITESNVRLIQEGKTWIANKHHLWTQEDDAIIASGINDGLSLKKVADLVGQKYTATVARVYRLGLGAKSGHHACKGHSHS